MDEQNKKEINSEKEKLTLSEIIKFTIITLILVIPLRMFVAEPYLVRLTSMYPTFKDSDYLIVEKISKKNIKRGDVIIFKSPVDNRNLIKRVIGLPGEKITLNKGVFEIEKENGEKQILIEKYVVYQDLEKQTNIKLTGNQYFVSGDNRAGSYDSRDWGALPKENIIGKPFLRFFHFNAIGVWPGKISI
jgi:signal peptidase I